MLTTREEYTCECAVFSLTFCFARRYQCATTLKRIHDTPSTWMHACICTLKAGLLVCMTWMYANISCSAQKSMLPACRSVAVFNAPCWIIRSDQTRQNQAYNTALKLIHRWIYTPWPLGRLKSVEVKIQFADENVWNRYILLLANRSCAIKCVNRRPMRPK